MIDATGPTGRGPRAWPGLEANGGPLAQVVPVCVDASGCFHRASHASVMIASGPPPSRTTTELLVVVCTHHLVTQSMHLA
jgi:hypothetical protein